MRYIQLFLILLIFGFHGVSVTGSPTVELVQRSDFVNHVVFDPPDNYLGKKVNYARSLQLADGSLILTFLNLSPEPPVPYFPIWGSTDGGETWSERSRVVDTINGWGFRHNPFLFLLDREIGAYPANTVLLAGIVSPRNDSASHMELYASKDNATTWEYVSRITSGGQESTDDGAKAIWEPFLMSYDGHLVCYYSDQRDSLHSQKLVHQSTSDLKIWNDPVTDVAYSRYSARPGMTTVAYIRPVDKYLMTYEYPDDTYGVHYRIASNPLKFLEAPDYSLRSNVSHTKPSSSPYVIWTEKPNATNDEGLLIMNAASNSEVFVNDANGSEDQWSMKATGQEPAYSRSLCTIYDGGEKKLLIAGGGPFSGGDRKVTIGKIDIPV